MNARLTLAEGIQECLETVQEIQSCNREERYLAKLDEKLDAAEKAQVTSELTTASLITTGQMFLRLGLATVIVVGNQPVAQGETDLFTYILFLHGNVLSDFLSFPEIIPMHLSGTQELSQGFIKITVFFT